MKVLMLCLANDLRFDQRVRRSAAALAAAGHDVVAVGTKSWETPETEVTSEGYTILRLPIGPFPLFPNEGMFRHIPRLLRFRPDVVHAHDIHPLLLGIVVAALSNARLVYDSHECWPASYDVNPAWRWVRSRERLAALLADLWIVPSDGVGEELRRRYGIHAPVLTIRNVPADLEPARDLPAPVQWPRDRSLVFWGTIKRGRMLDEVKRLMRERRDLHLVLAGEGEMLRGFLDDAELRDRVHYLGLISQESILALGGTCAVGLSLYVPAVGDTPFNLPNKIFEFVRCGLPVVATDLPEMRRVVDETGSGVVVIPGDYDSFRDGVDRVLASLEKYRRCAEASRGRYPWRAEADRLAEAYRSLNGTR